MIGVVTPGSSGNPVNQPLGVGNETGVNAYGGVGIVKVTGLSSDIPISTAPKVILTAFNSDIEIEDVIIQTDGTGLATGTTFELRQSGDGLTVWASEAVASLGANVTLDFSSLTVGQKFVLQQGKTISIDNTVAAGTGAGKFSLWFQYRPMTAAGSLA
jgi:hypothetical protein